MKSFRTAKIFLAVMIILLSAGPLLAGYYEQGRSFFVYKKYDRAKEMFLKATEKREHGDALYFLGEIEKIQGNFRTAEDYFARSVASGSTTGKYLKNAYWDLIILAEQRGDYGRIISTCKRMWEKYNDEGARQKIETMINKHLWTDNAAAIAEYERGIKLRKQDNDEARDSFREAIRLAPEFLAPKFELGMMAYRKGDNSGAESYLGEIISRIPYYAEAHLVMADISFTKRSYSAAVEHYDRAIEFGFIGKSTLYMIRLRKAQCFYNLDRFTEAVESATDAAKMSPGETEPLIVLSAVYIRQNDLDRAIETLSRANSIQKDNPLVIYQLGSIYYSRDDWRYLSHFDRLFDLTKSENPESYRRIIPILVKGHFEKKNYNRVMEILDSQPSESISYEFTLLRAKSLFHLRQYDACIDQMQKLSLGNEDRLMLASAYAHSGRQPNAKDILQSLVRDGEYKSRAMKDPVLAPIVNEIERERVAREKAEREKLEKEKAERERLEKERLEREKAERERAERERLEKEKSERERREKEQNEEKKAPGTDSIK